MNHLAFFRANAKLTKKEHLYKKILAHQDAAQTTRRASHSAQPKIHEKQHTRSYGWLLSFFTVITFAFIYVYYVKSENHKENTSDIKPKVQEAVTHEATNKSASTQPTQPPEFTTKYSKLNNTTTQYIEPQTGTLTDESEDIKITPILQAISTLSKDEVYQYFKGISFGKDKQNFSIYEKSISNKFMIACVWGSAYWESHVQLDTSAEFLQHAEFLASKICHPHTPIVIGKSFQK